MMLTLHCPIYAIIKLDFRINTIIPLLLYLNVVSMSRTVYMAIVSFVCLILYNGCIDCDSSGSLLWCLVYVIVCFELCLLLT